VQTGLIFKRGPAAGCGKWGPPMVQEHGPPAKLGVGPGRNHATGALVTVGGEEGGQERAGLDGAGRGAPG
jgi:hypothetical protein